MEISHAIDRFVEWGRMDYTNRTLDVYVSHLRKFQIYIKNKNIEEIRLFEDIIKYGEKLRKTGKRDATINISMTAIRQLWKFLDSTKKELKVNLSFHWQIIPIKHGIRTKSHAPIEEEDFYKILRVIKNEDFGGIRDEAILRTLYDTGARVSELTAIDIDDVDLMGQSIRVVTRKRRDLVKERIVPITKSTSEVISEYAFHRKFITNEDSLFINLRDKTRITTRSIERIVKKYCILAGLDHTRIRPHSFRHGLGMRCAEAEMYPPHLQELLGHNNLNSSKVYYNIKNKPLLREYHAKVGDLKNGDIMLEYGYENTWKTKKQKTRIESERVLS